MDHAQAHFEDGIGALRRGDLTRAQSALTTAITLSPGYGEAWHQLGLVHFLAQNLDAAIRSISRAVTLGVDDARVFFNLATALQRAGRLDEALARYAEALERDPLKAPSRYLVFLCCF